MALEPEVPKSFMFLQALSIIVFFMLRICFSLDMSRVSFATSVVNGMGMLFLTMGSIISVTNLYFAHEHKVAPHRLMPMTLAFVGLCFTLLVSTLKPLGGSTSPVAASWIHGIVLVLVLVCTLVYISIANRSCQQLVKTSM